MRTIYTINIDGTTTLFNTYKLMYESIKSSYPHCKVSIECCGGVWLDGVNKLGQAQKVNVYKETTQTL
jgi:ABC-type phosphate transport system substrate-binding protein